MIVATGLLAIGALSIALGAYQQPAAGGQPAPKVVEVDKIKDNLYVLKGGGGNTAVFIGTNGVVVVDTKTAGWGQVILAKIQELTPKPVTTIINTHSHFDHVSGNVEFPNVEVVAQENLRKVVEAWPSVYGLTNNPPNVFKENNGKNLPTKMYKDKMTLGGGADRIDLFYFGRGHTNNDSWVVFPALRVAHAGDMFAGKTPPIMDLNAGGSGVEYPETLTKAYNSIANVDAIITGHSATTMPWSDLKVYADFNRDFLNAVREAKRAGKSVDEFAAGWKNPEKYVGYPAAQAARVKTNTQAIYEELGKPAGTK
jgi:glyoxylase-like metal-dependent hydrolase (beta-lactamase superfamily II)